MTQKEIIRLASDDWYAAKMDEIYRLQRDLPRLTDQRYYKKRIRHIAKQIQHELSLDLEFDED